MKRQPPKPVVVQRLSEACDLMKQVQEMVERDEQLEPMILRMRRVLSLLEEVEYGLAQEELDKLMRQRKPNAKQMAELLDRLTRRAA